MNSYAIVYSSNTGNTAMLATELYTALAAHRVVHFGAPHEGIDADVQLIGFWTDKGEGDDVIKAYLQSLTHQRLFLFGTAGFGEEEAYFAGILERTIVHLHPSNTIVGTFMCQGKMPERVRTRYLGLLEQEPHKAKRMLDNFERALSHPDASDLHALQVAIAPLL